MTGEDARRVSDHYGRPGLLEAILDGLRASGVDPASLQAHDLAAVDQFHSRGEAATLELAELAGITEATRVLDLGGGIGGPARALAARTGCRVTVVDLTEEFCRTGEALTRMTRLDQRVGFRHASALHVPFEDGSFDVVWTQHSTMNIEDKPGLFAEARRLLRPGGAFALHEIVAGTLQPIHFPVPWAREPSISFLSPASRVRSWISAAGFVEQAWVDVTEASREWFLQRAAAANAAASPPPLGTHLLLGNGAPAAFACLIRNLQEGRVTVVKGLFRPAGSGA